MEKTEFMKIRVSPTEKLAFQQAAEIAGISMSAWMRERLRLAAIRELESAGQQVPFVSSLRAR